MRALRLAALAGIAAVSFAQLRAGAAKRTITPDLLQGPVYLAGFGHNRVATAVHDDLWARCLSLSANTTLVVCGIDSIGLFLEDVQKIRDTVSERLARPVNLVIAALHDHEAPDTMGLWGPSPAVSGINEAYNLFVIDRTAEAALEAVRSEQKAKLKLARVQNAELDSFINDDRPPVVHDSELVILSAVDAGGKTIGTLINWANHPETLGSKNTRITADYPNYFYTELERRLGGVAVLVNGAVGGMQSPLGAKITDPKTGRPAEEESFRKAEILGTRVAALAAAAARSAEFAAVDKIEFREQAVDVPVTNKLFLTAYKVGIFKRRRPMTEAGTISTRTGLFRLSAGGDPLLEAALMPAELYPELSVGGTQRYYGADFPDAPIEPAVKKILTAPYRMLIGLADDEIGYLIPKAEWDEQPPYLEDAKKAWYGEISSPGPDAASRVIAAFQELADEAEEQ